MTALESAWYKRKSWALCLLPLSWLFRFVARLRRVHLQRRYQGKPFAVPVVVVGNITVGGTGKTPLIIALVKRLKQAGYRVGVVSRGYGGSASDIPRIVTAQSDAQALGDEPVVIAREAECPVVVARDRAAAVAVLIAQCAVDIVLSDDGLQHYRMHRDFEIAVLDGTRGLGNGQCLPAGPLREPAARLAEVDYIVFNGKTEHGLCVPCVKTPSSLMEIKPVSFLHLRSGERLQATAWPHASGVHAVAGIGNPARFSATLSALGLKPLLHSFPDHYPFQQSDLEFDDDWPVVMTAKDAIKCEAFAGDNVWVLEVEVQVPDTLFSNITRLLR